MSYISCPKSKAENKKHIAICKQCQDRKSCPSYLNFRQPESTTPCEAGGLDFRPQAEKAKKEQQDFLR
jgi:hypothetical protein